MDVKALLKSIFGLRPPATHVSSQNPTDLLQSETHQAYSSFAEALSHCDLKGYNDAELAQVMFAKTIWLKERRVQDWLHQVNAAATLEAVRYASSSKPVHVLDFGGNCGLHFLLAKQELGQPLRWAVVEMPLIVEASAALETDELRFFDTIATALQWLGRTPDLVHTSGALAFTSAPAVILSDLVAIGAPWFASLRGAVAFGPDRITVHRSRLTDNGPGAMPASITDRDVKIPMTFVSKHEFDRVVTSRYQLVKASRDERLSDWFSDGVRLQHGEHGIFALRG